MEDIVIEPKLRPELKQPLPERIRDLPVYRGYPVPWFVAWPEGKDGEPEFRAADGFKWEIATRTRACWVCGKKLGAYIAFVLGPMCCISRTTVEPACHRECAEWSIINCPFLSRPHMTRRENDLPEGAEQPPGEMLRRNPGVVALWLTRDYAIFPDEHDRPLLRVGEPLEVAWFSQGRTATRAEVTESVAGGLPVLIEMAKADGPRGEDDLAKAVAAFEKLLPEHA